MRLRCSPGWTATLRRCRRGCCGRLAAARCPARPEPCLTPLEVLTTHIIPHSTCVIAAGLMAMEHAGMHDHVFT